MLGNVHVPYRKNTAGMKPERLEGVKEVIIPMTQHIGAPSVPAVKAGDTVKVGTLIAEAGGYVGAPIHSPISGTVKKIDTHLTYSGKKCDAIVIEGDGLMTRDEGISPPDISDFDRFSAAVRASGVVGLGGAGFPTSVKLDAQKKGLIEKIIVNGAECEPYITSDTCTMLYDTDYIKRGVELLLCYTDAKEVIFGIESNKGECIDKLTELFLDNTSVSVQALPSTYPQGGEKILIYNTTGRRVPEGGLPADVGCLVINVTTLAFIAKYMESGMPLVEKCITVDGSAVKSPKNLIVPIGTKISEILAYMEIDEADVGKILLGGPMMGVSVWSLDDPIMKNTNALTVMNHKDAILAEPTPCIHCGRCVAACPMGLNPTAYAKAQSIPDDKEKVERLRAAKINLCIECGCCSYVCPAKRPLVQKNRLSKDDVRAYDAKMKELEQRKRELDEKKEVL